MLESRAATMTEDEAGILLDEEMARRDEREYQERDPEDERDRLAAFHTAFGCNTRDKPGPMLAAGEQHQN